MRTALSAEIGIWLRRLIALVCCLLPLGFSAAGTALSVREIAPGVFVFIATPALMNPDNHGAIANVGFVVGRDAVAVIDSGGSVAEGRALLAAIRRVTPLPVRYVINTHMHPDHIFGNAAFLSESGVKFVGHHKLAAALAARGDSYKASNRSLLGAELISEVKIIPPDVSVTAMQMLDLGDRMLELVAWPVAHTDNDLTVLDRRTGTFFAGDLIFISHLPVVDGRLKGWIAVMEGLARLPVRQVVPGHGPLAPSMVEALKDQSRYLDVLAKDLRTVIRRGGDLAKATEMAGRSEKNRWLLFEEYNARNATAGFVELEWE